MLHVNLEISFSRNNSQAHLKYQPSNDIYPIIQSCINSINDTATQNLIIEEDIKHKNARVPRITLPPLSILTNITFLSIRYIKISDNRLPSLPPNLQVLNLFNTSIHILDNLPTTLQILDLSTNINLRHVVLPPKLISFDASYQTNFDIITFPPTIVYLRFYHCAFTRLNRLSFDTLLACTHQRPCFVECRLPYTDVIYNQRTLPYNAQPHLLFECINNVNRQLDENITSIFYRIRDNSYSSKKIDCPIIEALRLSSNPPRRFSEFIVE